MSISAKLLGTALMAAANVLLESAEPGQTTAAVAAAAPPKKGPGRPAKAAPAVDDLGGDDLGETTAPKPAPAKAAAKPAPASAADDLGGDDGLSDDGLGGDDLGEPAKPAVPSENDVRAVLLELKKVDGNTNNRVAALLKKYINDASKEPFVNNLPADQRQACIDHAKKLIASGPAKK